MKANEVIVEEEEEEDLSLTSETVSKGRASLTSVNSRKPERDDESRNEGSEE